MKFTRQTRYKISIAASVFLALVVILSTFKATENIGVAAIAAIMTILTSYIWGETKRPSGNLKQ
jgi:hypothetical protein